VDEQRAEDSCPLFLRRPRALLLLLPLLLVSWNSNIPIPSAAFSSLLMLLLLMLVVGKNLLASSVPLRKA